MNTKENFKFASFGTALIACQLFVEHFALVGFHISVSIYRESHCINCSVFHDETFTVTPPAGFLYSSCKEYDSDGTYWTFVSFEY